MKRFLMKRKGLKLAILAILALPELAGAVVIFNYNQYGDVLAGFRKTGANEGKYELVVDLGSVTNFLKLSAGTTVNITNFSNAQLTNAFSDTGGFQKLQWSAFSAFPGGLSPWVTPLGSFPVNTLWLTLPGASVSTQTQPPVRYSSGTQQVQKALINGCGNGAAQMSSNLGSSDTNNTATLVRETVSDTQHYLTAFIGDINNTALGDFGANNAPLPYTVENTTSNSFTSAQRSDFYQLCPDGSTDPISGLTTGSAYFVGYFILNPNGTMTFTRASSGSAAPVAAFNGSPTNVFVTQTVAFSDASTGSITNWIWNFGDGNSTTNNSNVGVNHSYATAGIYTVSLTVSGAGGSNTNTKTGYVVVKSKPVFGKPVLSGGNLILSGTNGPVGAQYRILTSTNVAQSPASWTPIYTNVFGADGSYGYTNTMTTNGARFFLLVSP